MKNSMHIFLFQIFLIIISQVGCSSRSINRQESKTILWSSSESKKIFSQSINGDFFSLSSYYEPQVNKFSCGPATGTILLNALFLNDMQTEKPLDHSSYPLKVNYVGSSFTPIFAKFTQNTFLDKKSEKIKSIDVFYGKPNQENKQDGGLTLNQFANVLRNYGLKADIFYVDSLNQNSLFKKILLDSLIDTDSYLVVNFDRKGLGQNGGGHFSPLVAYNSEHDSFLVLDVNPVVTEWFWVSSETLFNAMNTLDSDKYRGFLRISKK